MDKDDMFPKTLLEKDGMKFVKTEKGKFVLTFSLESDKYFLNNLLNFEFIQLIYQLNGDIYEYVEVNKADDTNAEITLVLKHFFEDLGLPQKYSFLKMVKVVEKNKVIFLASAIKSYKPGKVPIHAETLGIDDLIFECDIVTPHKVNFTAKMLFDPKLPIPPFIEKFLGVINNKIFNKIKQFIEKLPINI